MFIRFDMIHERERRTDGETDRHRMTAYVALMHSIARHRFLRARRKAGCMGDDGTDGGGETVPYVGAGH